VYISSALGQTLVFFLLDIFEQERGNMVSNIGTNSGVETARDRGVKLFNFGKNGKEIELISVKS